MAVAIRMDSGGKITMDGSSSNGQQQRNWQWNGKTTVMGKAA
jgi:hypothetical protein